MDVIHDTTENTSFLKKDTVFAMMKFNLQSGSFRLLTEKSVLPRLSPSKYENEVQTLVLLSIKIKPCKYANLPWKKILAEKRQFDAKVQ